MLQYLLGFESKRIGLVIGFYLELEEFHLDFVQTILARCFLSIFQFFPSRRH
jgi:hypothetical protein